MFVCAVELTEMKFSLINVNVSKTKTHFRYHNLYLMRSESQSNVRFSCCLQEMHVEKILSSYQQYLFRLFGFASWNNNKKTPIRWLFHLKRFINPIYEYIEYFYRLIFICFTLRCRLFIPYSPLTNGWKWKERWEIFFWFAIGTKSFPLWFYLSHFSNSNWIQIWSNTLHNLMKNSWKCNGKTNSGNIFKRKNYGT